MAEKKEEKKEAILAPVEEIEVSETSLSSLSYKEEKPASFARASIVKLRYLGL